MAGTGTPQLALEMSISLGVVDAILETTCVLNPSQSDLCTSVRVRCRDMRREVAASVAGLNLVTGRL